VCGPVPLVGIPHLVIKVTALSLKALQVSFIIDGKLMIITFKTPESQYDSQIRGAEKFIDSIKRRQNPFNLAHSNKNCRTWINVSVSRSI
jgi:hypothetical protein